MHLLHRLNPIAALLALAVLPACTLIPHDPPASSQAAGGAGANGLAKPEKVVNVGSRIPNNAGDRMVRKTDAAGAKEMNRERPPEPGPKVN